MVPFTPRTFEPAKGKPASPPLGGPPPPVGVAPSPVVVANNPIPPSKAVPKETLASTSVEIAQGKPAPPLLVVRQIVPPPLVIPRRYSKSPTGARPPTKATPSTRDDEMQRESEAARRLQSDNVDKKLWGKLTTGSPEDIIQGKGEPSAGTKGGKAKDGSYYMWTSVTPKRSVSRTQEQIDDAQQALRTASEKRKASGTPSRSHTPKGAASTAKAKPRTSTSPRPKPIAKALPTEAAKAKASDPKAQLCKGYYNAVVCPPGCGHPGCPDAEANPDSRASSAKKKGQLDEMD